MDLAQLARGLCASRIAFGAGLILAPGLYGRFWIGPDARDDRARLLARSLGVRELALGAGGLAALRSGNRESARQWLAAGAATEAVDVLVALTGRPTPARAMGAAMAAANAAVAGAYAATKPSRQLG
jgi:hypothetical protein